MATYKGKYRVNPDLMLDLEGNDQKQFFEAMASAVEVFSHMDACGLCGTEKPRPVVRPNKKKQKFFEFHCTNPKCKARFALGQTQNTPTLFPQRDFPKSHPQAGQRKPNGGWVKCDPKHDEDGPAD